MDPDPTANPLSMQTMRPPAGEAFRRLHPRRGRARVSLAWACLLLGLGAPWAAVRGQSAEGASGGEPLSAIEQFERARRGPDRPERTSEVVNLARAGWGDAAFASHLAREFRKLRTPEKDALAAAIASESRDALLYWAMADEARRASAQRRPHLERQVRWMAFRWADDLVWARQQEVALSQREQVEADGWEPILAAGGEAGEVAKRALRARSGGETPAEYWEWAAAELLDSADIELAEQAATGSTVPAETRRAALSALAKAGPLGLDALSRVAKGGSEGAAAAESLLRPTHRASQAAPEAESRPSRVWWALALFLSAAGLAWGASNLAPGGSLVLCLLGLSAWGAASLLESAQRGGASGSAGVNQERPALSEWPRLLRGNLPDPGLATPRPVLLAAPGAPASVRDGWALVPLARVQPGRAGLRVTPLDGGRVAIGWSDWEWALCFELSATETGPALGTRLGRVLQPDPSAVVGESMPTPAPEADWPRRGAEGLAFVFPWLCSLGAALLAARRKPWNQDRLSRDQAKKNLARSDPKSFRAREERSRKDRERLQRALRELGQLTHFAAGSMAQAASRRRSGAPLEGANKEVET